MKTLNFLILLLCVLLSSCSYHIGSIGGGTGTVTNNQFRSIDFAHGTAKTTNILGIGGNNKDALVLEAKRNLYEKYKLSTTQVIGQTTVDFKRTFFFPVVTSKVTVSAEIIDFSDNVNDSTQIREIRNKFAGLESDESFGVGEVVDYWKKGKKYTATVIFLKEGAYAIKYLDDNDHIKLRVVKSGLYKIKDKK